MLPHYFVDSRNLALESLADGHIEDVASHGLLHVINKWLIELFKVANHA